MTDSGILLAGVERHVCGCHRRRRRRLSRGVLAKPGVAVVVSRVVAASGMQFLARVERLL